MSFDSISPSPEPADPVDPRCQILVQDFMLEMLDKGAPYDDAVRDVLHSFMKE